MADAARILANYQRSLARVGETIYVRRFSGSGPSRTHADTAATARVTGYDPHELIGSIVQGDRKVIMLAKDLTDAGFSLPVVKSDQLIVRGKPLAIQAVDDSTRRVAGTLIAIEIQVRG